jgi:hypothetical protein
VKRTWFAILFLLLVAGLCIFEQHTVKTSSWGFSSPIWRLPMIRIARMTVK